MEKKLIRRAKLAAQVLDLLRHEPGCFGVKEIIIGQVHVVNDGTTWRVSIVDYGDATRSTADHAADRIEQRLVQQYNLAD